MPCGCFQNRLHSEEAAALRLKARSRIAGEGLGKTCHCSGARLRKSAFGGELGGWVALASRCSRTLGRCSSHEGKSALCRRNRLPRRRRKPWRRWPNHVPRALEALPFHAHICSLRPSCNSHSAGTLSKDSSCTNREPTATPLRRERRYSRFRGCKDLRVL